VELAGRPGWGNASGTMPSRRPTVERWHGFDIPYIRKFMDSRSGQVFW